MKNIGKRIVLVLRSGGDFGFADVELLVHHILQHEPAADIYCLFDKAEKQHRLKDFTLLPLGKPWEGWWSKMNLFSPELESLRPFLFLDLDTAVVGRLPDILPPKREEAFICLRDFYTKQWMASGMMWLPANSDKINKVWQEWSKYPERSIKRFRGDQDFIRSVVVPDTYWQDEAKGISSFKPKGKGWLMQKGKETKVICFHGFPRPFQAARTVPWVNEYVKHNTK